MQKEKKYIGLIIAYENILQPEAFMIALDFQVAYIFVLRFII